MEITRGAKGTQLLMGHLLQKSDCSPVIWDIMAMNCGSSYSLETKTLQDGWWLHSWCSITAHIKDNGPHRALTSRRRNGLSGTSTRDTRLSNQVNTRTKNSSKFIPESQKMHSNTHLWANNTLIQLFLTLITSRWCTCKEEKNHYGYTVAVKIAIGKQFLMWLSFLYNFAFCSSTKRILFKKDGYVF